MGSMGMLAGATCKFPISKQNVSNHLKFFPAQADEVISKNHIIATNTFISSDRCMKTDLFQGA